MDQQEFATGTVWTAMEVTFRGPSLQQLLTRLGIEAQTLELAALNDYTIRIPVAELTDTVPILATRMDGERMAIRDKGPVWVVYPYDDSPKYRTEIIFSRSIWQLSSIRIVD